MPQGWIVPERKPSILLTRQVIPAFSNEDLKQCHRSRFTVISLRLEKPKNLKFTDRMIRASLLPGNFFYMKAAKQVLQGSAF